MKAASAGQRQLARKQVPESVTSKVEAAPEGTVNIWTGRRLKGFRAPKEKGPRVASKYKCEPALDQGWTRGEEAGVSYCCLYFARGLCHHGADCSYLHRVPDEAMALRHVYDHTVDIFGRDRNPASRDGLKRGTGSYERECRSLYVNYGGSALDAEVLRGRMEAAFRPWGPLEDVYVVPHKPLVFVRYLWRCSAEFAKAAMHQQSVSGALEVLDVRWANDDPNPAAVRRVQREREEMLRDAYVQAVNQLEPEAKRARVQQLHLLATAGPVTGGYPGTDRQYAAGLEYEDAGGADARLGWDEYYARHLDQTANATEGGDDAERTQTQAGPDEEDDVSRYLTAEELEELEQQKQETGSPSHITPADAAGNVPEAEDDDDAAALPGLLAAYDSDN